MPTTPSPDQVPIHELKGVGPKVQSKLQKLGIHTVEDLLWTLPHRYEDRRHLIRLAQLPWQGNVLVCGQILASTEARTSKARKRLYEVIISDGSGQLALKWFHYRRKWMESRYKVGQWIMAVGEIKAFGGQKELFHPEVECLKERPDWDALLGTDSLKYGLILPVYPLTEGLTQAAAQKIWHDGCSRFISNISSELPETISRKFHLAELSHSMQQLHWPNAETDLAELARNDNPWRRRLVFEEFFFLQLGLAMRKKGVQQEEGIAFALEHRYTKPLAQKLPYKLTNAQRRVLGEIKQDMLAPTPMNRLIQGDVGSGKTIVALMAALIAIENDHQVAVVAPTEILAEQHFLQFDNWLRELDLQAVLLTGSMSAAERRERYAMTADGRAQLVVGTHAVLQEEVEFYRLGLGIIDEQHRFGVKQRAMLRKKGANPDMLVMTATPIPRTLSMTVYGDLALSMIDEMPPGRKPVTTRWVPEGRRQQALEAAKKELEQGRQAYIVYPLVEESEKSDLKAATQAAEDLQKGVFADYRLGLLHGQQKADEKEAIMRAFKGGELDILVSTTVIEVGVDVPNATVMVIEHAERFGLAQLHQLRGRVGRGGHQSFCYLIAGYQLSEDSRKRLEVMVATNDGFRIAETDLEIRGPGEFLGTRQSGLPDFRVGNLLRDHDILSEARKAAFDMVKAARLEDPEFAPLIKELKRRWGSRHELATVA